MQLIIHAGIKINHVSIGGPGIKISINETKSIQLPPDITRLQDRYAIVISRPLWHIWNQDMLEIRYASETHINFNVTQTLHP